MLSDRQIDRYSRQILIAQIGGIGQQKLLAAQVAVLGDGEAGLTAATYLAAAGVGRLIVSDSACDNLQEIDDLQEINEDSVVRVFSGEVCDALIDGCCVILSTQTSRDGLARLSRACRARAATLLVGRDEGVWAVVTRPEDGDAVLGPACVRAGDGANNAASAFWVGSQLATAAIAAIVGLPLPASIQIYGELGSGIRSSQEECGHPHGGAG